MPEPLTIIGITGKARVGKDTAAAILSSFRGFFRIGLADGIREAFHGLSGSTGELYKALDAEHDYRRALQLFGTEARFDAVAGSLWSDLAKTKIAYLYRHSPYSVNRFVVPDVRYDREVAKLDAFARRLGGRFALIEIQKGDLIPIMHSDHSSEKGLQQYAPSVILHNDGTVDELQQVVLSVADEVLVGDYDRELFESLPQVVS